MRLTNFFVIWTPVVVVSHLLTGRAAWVTVAFCVVSFLSLFLNDSHLR